MKTIPEQEEEQKALVEQKIQDAANEVMELLGNLVKEKDRLHIKTAVTIGVRRGVIIGYQDADWFTKIVKSEFENMLVKAS